MVEWSAVRPFLTQCVRNGPPRGGCARLGFLDYLTLLFLSPFQPAKHANYLGWSNGLWILWMLVAFMFIHPHKIQ